MKTISLDKGMLEELVDLLTKYIAKYGEEASYYDKDSVVLLYWTLKAENKRTQ